MRFKQTAVSTTPHKENGRFTPQRPTILAYALINKTPRPIGHMIWYSAFTKDSAGQIKLDKTVVDINGRILPNLDAINPLVNKAYEARLEQLGASYMLDGAIEPRAQASTFELLLNTT